MTSQSTQYRLHRAAVRVHAADARREADWFHDQERKARVKFNLTDMRLYADERARALEVAAEIDARFAEVAA
jgi:hypothetical protein